MTGMDTTRTLSPVSSAPAPLPSRKGLVDLAVLAAFAGFVVWLLLV
jgi:hypothetical protein